MQAQMRNPDRRPLPSGWVDHYDTQRKLWYYVDINSTVPKVNFIHPEDQDPPTPPSGGYGYPSMPQAPSPPISPPQLQYQQPSAPPRQHRMSVGGTPFEQAQAQARTAQPSFAQKLYASSVNSQTAYPTPSSSVEERAPKFRGSPTQTSPSGGYFDSSSLFTSPVSLVPSPSTSLSGLPSPPVSPQNDPYNPSRRARGSRPTSSNGGSSYSFASLPSVSESTSNNDDFRSRALFQAAPAPAPSGPPAFNVSSHARNRSSTSPGNGFPSNANQNPLPSGVFMKPKEAPTYHTVARPSDSANGKFTTPALQPNSQHPQPHHANTLPAPAANGHFQLPAGAAVPVTNSLGLAQMPTPGMAPQQTEMSNGHALTTQMTGPAGQLPTPMQTPSIPTLPAGAAAPQMMSPSLPSMYQQYPQQQSAPAPTPVSNSLTPPPPPPHFTTSMQPPHLITSMQPPPPPPPPSFQQQSHQLQPQQPYQTQSQPYQTQSQQIQHQQIQPQQSQQMQPQQTQYQQMQPQQIQQSLQAPQIAPVYDPLAAAKQAAEEEKKKQQMAALKKAGMAMGKSALKFGAKIALGSVGVPGAVSDLAVNATLSGVSAVASAVSDNKPNSPTGLGGLPNLNFGQAGAAQNNAMAIQMQTLQLQQQQQAFMQQLAQQQQLTQQAMAHSTGQHQQQALAQQLALQQQQQQALSQQLAQQQAAMLKQQQLLAQQSHHKPQQSVLGNVLGQATHALVSTTLDNVFDNGSNGGGGGNFGGGNFGAGDFGAGSLGGGSLGGFDPSSMFDPGPDPSPSPLRPSSSVWRWHMETNQKNPDSRRLPAGWAEHFDSNRGVWYYINLGIANPRVTFVHPCDESASVPPPASAPALQSTSGSAESSSSSSMRPLGSRESSSSLGISRGRRATVAQQLYASSITPKPTVSPSHSRRPSVSSNHNTFHPDNTNQEGSTPNSNGLAESSSQFNSTTQQNQRAMTNSTTPASSSSGSSPTSASGGSSGLLDSHDPRNFFNYTRLSRGTRRMTYNGPQPGPSSAQSASPSSISPLPQAAATSQHSLQTPTDSASPSPFAHASTSINFNSVSTSAPNGVLRGTPESNTILQRQDANPVPDISSLGLSPEPRSSTNPSPGSFEQAQAFYHSSVVSKPLLVTASNSAPPLRDSSNLSSPPTADNVGTSRSTAPATRLNKALPPVPISIQKVDLKQKQPIRGARVLPEPYKQYTTVMEDDSLLAMPRPTPESQGVFSGLTEDNLMVLPSHRTLAQNIVQSTRSRLPQPPVPIDVSSIQSGDTQASTVIASSGGRSSLPGGRKSPPRIETRLTRRSTVASSPTSETAPRLVLQQPKPIRPLTGLPVSLNLQVQVAPQSLYEGESSKHAESNGSRVRRGFTLGSMSLFGPRTKDGVAAGSMSEEEEYNPKADESFVLV
ncbi:hypothetical protein CPB83DRAFT_878871 [Crepidotus variabilis]|uniref:WW domain-containing protein n=1 Tax=Crepidotus variabilis TaxID=179855 RepID=A0A9P6JX23_9AGAR|nr:hypothetical protein CPB83DRAFT_878871 [Crepidotus variabilis]